MTTNKDDLLLRDDALLEYYELLNLYMEETTRVVVSMLSDGKLYYYDDETKDGVAITCDDNYLYINYMKDCYMYDNVGVGMGGRNIDTVSIHKVPGLEKTMKVDNKIFIGVSSTPMYCSNLFMLVFTNNDNFMRDLNIKLVKLLTYTMHVHK